jgi:hypothetical protein
MACLCAGEQWGERLGCWSCVHSVYHMCCALSSHSVAVVQREHCCRPVGWEPAVFTVQQCQQGSEYHCLLLVSTVMLLLMHCACVCPLRVRLSGPTHHSRPCSEVSLMPSTLMGSRKISIKGGSDVTNQTCLYPGVTVMPGACLGVFTYAEAERTFPRDCIVQVCREQHSVRAVSCWCWVNGCRGADKFGHTHSLGVCHCWLGGNECLGAQLSLAHVHHGMLLTPCAWVPWQACPAACRATKPAVWLISAHSPKTYRSMLLPAAYVSLSCVSAPVCILCVCPVCLPPFMSCVCASRVPGSPGVEARCT